MRSSTTINTKQWLGFGILCFFSSLLLVLCSSSELSLTELKYVIHRRGFNEPARLYNLSEGIKRSLSSSQLKRRSIVQQQKRDATDGKSGSDDTKSNKTSTSAPNSKSTDDYALLEAYFAPNVSEAHALLSKKLTVKTWLATHRTDWIACCSESLTSGSENFAKNETFGWLHFQQQFDKSKIVDEIIVTIDVGCYEVSQYDPTGENPGDPVKDFTQEVINKLKWTKTKAKEDAKALRNAFENHSSSNSISTEKKNSDDTSSGVQNSKGNTSKTGDNTSTDEKKPSQTTNDSSKKTEKTTDEAPDENSSKENSSTEKTSSPTSQGSTNSTSTS